MIVPVMMMTTEVNIYEIALGGGGGHQSPTCDTWKDFQASSIFAVALADEEEEDDEEDGAPVVSEVLLLLLVLYLAIR